MSKLKNIKINIFILIFLLSSTQEQFQKGDKPEMNNDIPPPDKDRNSNNDNKLNEINNLKKKYERIIKENNNSKAKLKKYNLYYYIFEIINIIFALFISLYFMNQIYYFYKYKYNIITNHECIDSVIDIKIKNNNANNNEIHISDKNNIFHKSENHYINQQNNEIKYENNSIINIGAPPATFMKQNSK